MQKGMADCAIPLHYYIQSLPFDKNGRLLLILGW
jgi:hypothetical protein